MNDYDATLKFNSLSRVSTNFISITYKRANKLLAAIGYHNFERNFEQTCKL